MALSNETKRLELEAQPLEIDKVNESRKLDLETQRLELEKQRHEVAMKQQESALKQQEASIEQQQTTTNLVMSIMHLLPKAPPPL